jgi:hypothetical protein
MVLTFDGSGSQPITRRTKFHKPRTKSDVRPEGGVSGACHLLRLGDIGPSRSAIVGLRKFLAGTDSAWREGLTFIGFWERSEALCKRNGRYRKKSNLDRACYVRRVGLVSTLLPDDDIHLHKRCS